MPTRSLALAVSLLVAFSTFAGPSRTPPSEGEIFRWKIRAYQKGWRECWSIYTYPPSAIEFTSGFDFDSDDPQPYTPFMQAPFCVGVAKSRGFSHCRMILMPLSRTLGKGYARTIVLVIDEVTDFRAYRRRSSSQSSLDH